MHLHWCAPVIIRARGAQADTLCPRQLVLAAALALLAVARRQLQWLHAHRLSTAVARLEKEFPVPAFEPEQAADAASTAPTKRELRRRLAAKLSSNSFADLQEAPLPLAQCGDGAGEGAGESAAASATASVASGAADVADGVGAVGAVTDAADAAGEPRKRAASLRPAGESTLTTTAAQVESGGAAKPLDLDHEAAVRAVMARRRRLRAQVSGEGLS